MTILLDNTILTNFSTVRRPDLVRLAFVGEVVTTVHVFHEMQVGMAIGKVPFSRGQSFTTGDGCCGLSFSASHAG